MNVSNEELLRAYEMQQRHRKCNAEYMRRYRAQHQNRDEWNKQQRVMYLKRKANNLKGTEPAFSAVVERLYRGNGTCPQVSRTVQQYHETLDAAIVHGRDLEYT